MAFQTEHAQPQVHSYIFWHMVKEHGHMQSNSMIQVEPYQLLMHACHVWCLPVEHHPAGCVKLTSFWSGEPW